MAFAASAPLIDTAGFECIAALIIARSESFVVASHCFLSNGAKADAFYSGCRFGEIFIDNRFVDADSFEDLCPTVRGDSRDAHFRHGLNHAVEVGLEIVVASLIGVDFDVATTDEVANGFECEIRVDYVGTIAKEQSEMLNFTRFT